MVGSLDDFDVVFVGRAAGDAKAGGGEDFFVVAVEFVAVTMALADFEFAVGAMGEGAGFEFAGPGAEAHGAAHFIHAEQFAEFVDDAVRSLRVALSGIGVFESRDPASVLYRGTLHT